MALLLSCGNNDEALKVNSEIVQCKFIKDSVDFGTGKTAYNPEKLCLDSVFTYDYFESSAVKHQRVKVVQYNDTSSITWNGKQCSTFLFNDSVYLLQQGKKSVLAKQKDYSIASAFQIDCSDEVYLAVFLFQRGVSNALPDYTIILLNSSNQLVRYIENENQLSPSSGCFCDINADGQLDYLNVDRYQKKINCYSVENWRLLKKYALPIREWMDLIYVWDTKNL